MNAMEVNAVEAPDNAPLVLAVPSKGRLQENAEAFFTRAGLSLAKPRGARDYRGTIMGLDNVEIAYLSASEIASQLARVSPSPTRTRHSLGKRSARSRAAAISVAWSFCGAKRATQSRKGASGAMPSSARTSERPRRVGGGSTPLRIARSGAPERR